ncbi:hypothetical protein ZIOFF_038829 [Zingiber officinale]|uniref:Uncharacterized protein n=1 Tax=Zingiber officinale TaxID=94328 RepID=A0A8J5KSW7_ZINOF|nr:hypothetical protein ZIOFF_038829 [Zingiber officinale]
MCVPLGKLETEPLPFQDSSVSVNHHPQCIKHAHRYIAIVCQSCQNSASIIDGCHLRCEIEILCRGQGAVAAFAINVGHSFLAAARGYSNTIKRSIHPVVEDMGKQITNEQRSSCPDEISGRTPMKMLISQEMCGGTESTKKPPSVIARLMGLDSIPAQKWETSKEKVRNNSYLSNGLADELHQCKHNHKEYFDVYEVEQPTKDIWIDEQSVRKARLVENSHKIRTVLVREKFLEAKRLATDGKFLDSQEFQDAVKVLNSNRDLFIKFLEESNSVFTKQPLKPQSLSLPSQTTPITVLKPSNTMDSKGNQSMGKQLLSDSDANIGKVSKRYWGTGFCEPKHDALSQRTRIVILKPSNLHTLQGTHNSSRDLIAADELVSSRKELEEVSEEEEESVFSIRKDEALSMSVLSTGYIGDESSFNRSDCVYLEDEVGSTNEYDAASSATEYSWDYINKISSPLSTSSFNQTSPSPESSVIVEAKKRLSERLSASVASNVHLRELRHLRTTSTLREMLSIPESTKQGRIEEDLTHSNKPFDAEDILNAPSASFPTFEETSQQNSLRSSLAHGIDDFNVGLSGSLMVEPTVRTVVPKSNNRKLSFKDKISSFFFSGSKNPSRDELSRAASVPDVISSFSDTFVSPHGRSTEMLMLSEGVPKEKSRKLTDFQDKSGHNSASEDMLLDAENSLSESFGGTIAARPPVCRSPLIKSVRSSYLDLASTKPSNPFMVFTKADEEYEQFAFLQKLLSSSGMNSINQMLYRGWYSLDSPLNPSLLHESLHMEDRKEKSQMILSSRRLLFDSINTALLDICQSALLAAYPWTQRPVHKPREEHHDGDAAMAEQVWAIVRKGSNGDKWISKEPCYNSNMLTKGDYCYNSNMIDRLVKEEVAGSQGDAARWLEVCEFSKEIGGKVLEELVEELLSELSHS